MITAITIYLLDKVKVPTEFGFAEFVYSLIVMGAIVFSLQEDLLIIQFLLK